MAIDLAVFANGGDSMPCHSQGDVHHAQQGEHERLHQRDERSQHIEHHGNDDLGEVGENLQHHMVAGHVAEESQRQGERSHEIIDQFQGNHEHTEPPYRSDKVPQIPHTLLVKAIVIESNKRQHPEGQGHVEIAGGWRETWKQTNQVGAENEQEEAAVEMNVVPSIVPQHVLGHASDTLDEEFGNVAQGERVIGDGSIISGDQLAIRQVGEKNQNPSHEERCCGMSRQSAKARDDLDPGEGMVLHTLVSSIPSVLAGQRRDADAIPLYTPVLTPRESVRDSDRLTITQANGSKETPTTKLPACIG